MANKIEESAMAISVAGAEVLKSVPEVEDVPLLDCSVEPPVQKKRAGRKKVYGSPTERKRAERQRKKDAEYAAYEYELRAEEAAEIGVTLPTVEEIEAAKKPAPTDAEPEYPTKTGDEEADQAAMARYKAELQAFQDLWSRYLDNTNAMTKGIGQAISGGYDSARIDLVCRASERSIHGRRVQPSGAKPEEVRFRDINSKRRNRR